MLASQRRYAEMAARAEAANAQHEAAPVMAESTQEEVADQEDVSAGDLADFIRQNPRNAVIISEILAPPKGLRS